MILVFFVAQNLVIVVAAAARVGSWKYLKDPSGEHLFDLSTDPGEKSDLRTGKREQFEMLRRRYQSWAAQMLPLGR
jgi:hypothetical protein